MNKTPLAWKNFIHNKPRLLASVGGVAFAVILMFVEMGFLNGLFDSQTYVVEQMNADLLIINKHKEAVVPKLPFPKARLTQAKSHPDVVGAYPVYVEEFSSLWKNPEDGSEHPILIYAFEPDDPVFLIPDIRNQSKLLKKADTALLDAKSKEFFGRREPGVKAELSRRNVTVVGTFPLGSDFRVDGNVILSTQTFFKLFSQPGALTRNARKPVESKVEFGIIKVRDGADVEKVRRSLEAELGDDVRVVTKDEFISGVKSYWGTSKPVGYVFGMGMAVGFLIGVVICYQILYSDIVDHLPQYATLKAIGYGNNYLVKLVLLEALYLAFIGFVPGLLVSLGIYAILQHITGILMILTPWRMIMVLGLTVVMCVVSALIAIRKAVSSDPAEVF